MRNLYKTIWASVLFLGFAACSLEEDPYGFLSTDNFYQSESDAYAALVYAYDPMTTVPGYGRYMYYVGTLGTEEFTLKSDAQPADHELDQWNTLPTNIVLDAVFANAYNVINRSNAIIKHVPDIEMDVDTRNQIVGEAYFLRALQYFNLVRTFGDVPIRKAPVVSSKDLPAPLSPMQEVYTLIEEDLLKAEELMDEVLRDGRANKVAAQALLSKVYLTLASASATGVEGYGFVSESEQLYDNAENYAEKVLNNNSGYSFWEGSLIDLWDVDNQVGNEFIFSLGTHIEGAISEGDYTKTSMLMVPYVSGSNISLGPDFNTTIPDGWGHLNSEIPFYESFNDNDKRKTELIVSEVETEGGTVYTYPGNLLYPFSRKYIDKNQVGDQTGHYIPVIRFSDIALVYAEATGATSEAYEWVNKIRERAGLDELPEGMSDEEFRNAVLEERAYELAYEGGRLFDLRRTNRVEEVLEGRYGKDVSEYAYYYAIPQNEKDTNPLID